MNFESAKLLHVGISYLIAPISDLNEQKEYEFQGHLMKAQLGLGDRSREDNAIIAIRRKPTSLEIKIATVGPQVAQLLIVAPHPNRDIKVFIEEVEEVITAVKETWMEANFQIITSDATIRQLYDSSREHAFSELWEDKLGQPKEKLSVFGRSVLGGGLRFVMPQRDNEEDPKQVEVKVESFLQDPKQVFVEVQFIWASPVVVSSTSDFRARERLSNLESFIEKRVHKFMEG